MRRITAALTSTIAAGFVTAGLAAALAAPASAEPNTLELFKAVNGEVATVDCGTLGTLLRSTGMVDDTTTRSQLVKNLNAALGNDASLRLVAGGTIGAVGDRALACGIVKADPVTPIDQVLKMSSDMSSQAGLPQIKDLLPALR